MTGDEFLCVSTPFVPCCLSTRSGTVAVARYRSMLGIREQSAPTDAPTRGGLIRSPVRSFRSRRRWFRLQGEGRPPGEGRPVRHSCAREEITGDAVPAHGQGRTKDQVIWLDRPVASLKSVDLAPTWRGVSRRVRTNDLRIKRTIWAFCICARAACIILASSFGHRKPAVTLYPLPGLCATPVPRGAGRVGF